MTKMAQCGDCIGDSVHCEHYHPYDDSPCEHFQKSVDDEDKSENIPYYLFTLVFIFLTLIFPVLPTVIFVLGGLLALFIILLIRQYLKKRFKYRKMEKLLVEAIRSIGCQPVVGEDHQIEFGFQGENFVICMLSDKFISIRDPWWATLALDDPDFPQLKRAINDANINNIPTTLYSINEENNIVGIHCIYNCLFIPEIPDGGDFLRCILESFFDVHNEVKGRFQQLKDEQVQVEKKKRVVVKGFTR